MSTFQSKEEPVNDGDLDASIHGDAYPVQQITPKVFSETDLDASVHGDNESAVPVTLQEDHQDIVEYLERKRKEKEEAENEQVIVAQSHGSMRGSFVDRGAQI